MKIERRDYGGARPHSLDFTSTTGNNNNQFYNHLQQQQEPPADDFELGNVIIPRASSTLVDNMKSIDDYQLEHPPTEPKSDEEIFPTQSIPTEGNRQELMDSPSFKDRGLNNFDTSNNAP